MSTSNPFMLTEEAIRLISEGNGAIGGFKSGHWTHLATQQLASHKDRLTVEMAKVIAKEHNTKPRLVHIVKRKLQVLGLWNKANGGLGGNLGKLPGKQEKPVAQNANGNVPNVPNGVPQLGGQSTKILSNDPSNVPDRWLSLIHI